MTALDGRDPLNVAREHGLDLDQLDALPDDPDTPASVRPWVRLWLALQLELGVRGVQVGPILLDARHGALVDALVELGKAQRDYLRGYVREGVDDWPTLDPDAVELAAVLAAIANALELRAEIHRQDEHTRAEHEAARFRAALLDGVPGHGPNGHPHP